MEGNTFSIQLRYVCIYKYHIIRLFVALYYVKSQTWRINYNLCKLVKQQLIYIRKSNKKISSVLVIFYKKWPKMNFLECYVKFICIIIIAIFITFSSNCKFGINQCNFILFTNRCRKCTIKNILNDGFISGKEICMKMFNNFKYSVKLFLNVYWMDLTFKTLLLA